MVSWFVKQALLDLAARSRRRRTEEPRSREDWARLMQQVRRQGHPHRRAGHPARQDSEKPHGRVRQHLVGRRLRVGRHAAGRARLGHAREMDAGERRARRGRAAGGDLPAAAGRQYAGAHLVPDARPAIRLPRHPQRVDLDLRLLHGARERRRAVYRPTCHYAYHPCERGGAVAARDVRQCRQGAGGAPHPRRERDRGRHRRARRPALRPRAGTPIGMARSSRSRRRAGLRPTRTRPACR